MNLAIEASAQGESVFVIALRGEVDYASARSVREAVSGALSGHGMRVLIIDLAGITFLDSTGVGTLVVASRICGELGVRLRIRNVNPFIARLFAVLGVSDALGVVAPGGAVTPRRMPRQRVDDPLVQPA